MMSGGTKLTRDHFTSMLRAGIVVLPNVGKSTLFNAIALQQTQ